MAVMPGPAENAYPAVACEYVLVGWSIGLSYCNLSISEHESPSVIGDTNNYVF